jgi:hypothetical protein
LASTDLTITASSFPQARMIFPFGFIEPCLPSKVARPHSGSFWVHEINRGYRVGAYRGYRYGVGAAAVGAAVPRPRWLRLRCLRQLGLPTVLSGATAAVHVDERGV